jgi:hypothetical protein
MTISKQWNLLAFALLLMALTLAVSWSQLPYKSADSQWYISMANGASENVPEPFAGRLIHTSIAGLLVLAGIDAEWAFVLLSALSLFITLLSIFWIHQKGGLPPVVTIFALSGWLAVSLLRDSALPDIHASAWLSLVIIASMKKSFWVIPLLFIAILCRESLALFAAVLVLLSWRDRQFQFTAMIIIATGVGLFLRTSISGSENVHLISGPVYLATKALFNFSRNILGIELYVNTIDYCQPSHIWTLPSWFPSGQVTEIGICGFNFHRPFWLLSSWFGVFGVLPGLLWAHRLHMKSFWTNTPVWLRAVFYYGISISILAPVTGTALNRLVGYGWPAFWIVIPMMIWKLNGTRRQLFSLGLIHTMIAVLVPMLAVNIQWDSSWSLLAMSILAGIAIGANCLVFVLVRRR